MSTSTQWIKRSEREPKKEEFPLLAGNYDGGDWAEWIVKSATGSLGSAIYFRSIKADPPPRELTQREKDEAWAVELVDRNAGINRVGVALEAIYAERREVKALIDRGFWDHGWGTDRTQWSEVNCQLRARLDELGKF